MKRVFEAVKKNQMKPSDFKALCPKTVAQKLLGATLAYGGGGLSALGYAKMTGKAFATGVGITAMPPLKGASAFGGSLSVQWIADPAGNIGIAISTFGGAGIGAGGAAGIQFTRFDANTIFDATGTGGAVTLGGGDGEGASVTAGTDNSVSITLGAAVGGYGAAGGNATTMVLPLVCK